MPTEREMLLMLADRLRELRKEKIDAERTVNEINRDITFI